MNFFFFFPRRRRQIISRKAADAESLRNLIEHLFQFELIDPFWCALTPKSYFKGIVQRELRQETLKRCSNGRYWLSVAPLGIILSVNITQSCSLVAHEICCAIDYLHQYF
jgi:hypothetical protein